MIEAPDDTSSVVCDNGLTARDNQRMGYMVGRLDQIAERLDAIYHLLASALDRVPFLRPKR